MVERLKPVFYGIRRRWLKALLPKICWPGLGEFVRRALSKAFFFALIGSVIVVGRGRGRSQARDGEKVSRLK